MDNVQFLEKIGYFEDLEFCAKIPDVDSLIAKVHYYNWHILDESAGYAII